MIRRATKRAFDIATAITALLLLSPLFILVAAAVKLGSRGPVFFGQERVGLNGRSFRIIKFRTMVQDATVRGPNVSGQRDPRITWIGAFLRRTYLDEVPQFLNVLRGEMSMVGPRPETPEYVALYTEEERAVLSVKPGMAGPATVVYSPIEAEILSGQPDPERYYVMRLLHQRVRLDLEYLRAGSLSYDLRILIQTLRGVFRPGRGPSPPEGASGIAEGLGSLGAADARAAR